MRIKVKVEHAVLFAVLAVGSLLRFYFADQQFFMSDHARNIFQALGFARGHHLLLSGPPHHGFRPPLSAYFFALLLTVFKSPFLVYKALAFLDAGVVLLTYVFCKRFFNAPVALCAISLFGVWLFRVWGFWVFQPETLASPLVILFFWMLLLMVTEGRRQLLIYLLGLLSLLVQINPSPFVLVIVLLGVYCIDRRHFQATPFWIGAFLFLLLLLPYIIYEATAGAGNAKLLESLRVFAIVKHNLRNFDLWLFADVFLKTMITTDAVFSRLGELMGGKRFLLVIIKMFNYPILLFFAAGVLTMLRSLLDRHESGLLKKKYTVVLLWFFFGLFFIRLYTQSIYSGETGGLWTHMHHYLVLDPAQFIIIGIGAWAILLAAGKIRKVALRIASCNAVIAVIVAVVFSQALLSFLVLQHISKTGRVNFWTTFYRLPSGPDSWTLKTKKEAISVLMRDCKVTPFSPQFHSLGMPLQSETELLLCFLLADGITRDEERGYLAQRDIVSRHKGLYVPVADEQVCTAAGKAYLYESLYTQCPWLNRYNGQKAPDGREFHYLTLVPSFLSSLPAGIFDTQSLKAETITRLDNLIITRYLPAINYHSLWAIKEDATLPAEPKQKVSGGEAVSLPLYINTGTSSLNFKIDAGPPAHSVTDRISLFFIFSGLSNPRFFINAQPVHPILKMADALQQTAVYTQSNLFVYDISEFLEEGNNDASLYIEGQGIVFDIFTACFGKD